VLTVYIDPVSLYCAKLRIVLRHKQLDRQELQPPGGYGSEEYAQLVPAGNLPALVDGDLLLADSEAITEYLNEKYTDYPLLPTDIFHRAKIRELSRFHDTRLEPQVRALFPLIKSANRDAKDVAQQGENINLSLKYLAQLIENSRFPLSESFTLADSGFAISFVWIEHLSKALNIDINWPEEVSRYRVHIEQFNAVKEELADYLPKATAWIMSANASEA